MKYPVDAAIAEGNGYTIVENASLEARNTFHVPARAKLLIDIRKREALSELFGFPALKSEPLLVLGEGSNILFTRDWPGVVVSVAARGIAILHGHAERARIRVEAGENWNDFVHWSIAQGFAGLENLAAIPGTVGAAPIQNIGAYGVEVREFVHDVEACGFKGLREGDAGVSSEHALVLVNHGRATGAEIRALAERIQSEVLRQFGIELQPEPLII